MDKTQVVTTDGGSKIVNLTPAQVEENMRLIDDLKFFLATAPANWQKNQIIRRYYLNHDEGFVSCVFWNNLYFITGTDIVRCIVYRFEQFGREIVDRKKFEEGIFSDLRSLKCGTDAVLEPSKSPFLDFLYRNSCLRTQKKQKVFFWFSVPHDKLFADALERDLKKELVDQPSTTRAKQEPALSFNYNANSPLHEQLLAYVESQKSQTGAETDVDATITPNSNVDLSQTPDAHGNNNFVIREEPGTGTPVVTPGRLEDDFPLDYFPQSSEPEPMLIDPSVFMNPPEHFEEPQFLIDQAYAKTPFYETFDAERQQQQLQGQQDDSFDEDNFVPISQIPASGVVYPGMSPMVAMPGYYLQPQGAYAHMTNGQYYDAQLNGEPFEQEWDPQLQHPGPPGYYQYPPGYYNPYEASPQNGTPQPQMYEYMPQGHYPPPAFFGETDDGEVEVYENYERSQSMSPFARVFPSFQATAPPSRPASAKSVRFPPRSATSKVMKPSSLRQQRSVANLKGKTLERVARDVADKQDAEGEEREHVKSEHGEVEVQEIPQGQGAQDEDEEECTTLPTPESTAHEQQNQGQTSSHEFLNENV